MHWKTSLYHYIKPHSCLYRRLTSFDCHCIEVFIEHVQKYMDVYLCSFSSKCQRKAIVPSIQVVVH